ncbi:MAG: hypothetical protein R3C10_03260 [Pirellulales bacterium]
MINPANGDQAHTPLNVRILRQDGPGEPSYWERHTIPYGPDMNVISVLQRQRRRASFETADGRRRSRRSPKDCNCLERSAAPAR